MEKVAKIFYLVIFIIIATPVGLVSGQEPEGTVKYTPEFRFKDGIYLNFEQVRITAPFQRQSCSHRLIIMTGISLKV